jgi:hypothetical protein
MMKHWAEWLQNEMPVLVTCSEQQPQLVSLELTAQAQEPAA